MDTLYINMLGTFTMRLQREGAEDKTASLSGVSGRMLCFLAYLATFSTREVAQDELLDFIGDDIDSADPVSLIRTLLHRSRSILEDLGFENGKNILCYSRKRYYWSKDINLKVDTLEFERLNGMFCKNPAEFVEYGLEALKLYSGDFLKDVHGNLWVISRQTYFHARFIALSHDVAEILAKIGRRREAVKILKDAVSIDPLAEDCQLLLMKLLRDGGFTNIALQHYSKVQNLYMDQYGIALSDDFVSFYRETVNADQPRQLDLRIIRGDMAEEKAKVKGALFCEFSVFEGVYRFMARSMSRLGLSIELALITLFAKNGDILGKEQCGTVMNGLQKAISNNLRSGDAFTRFSRDQFLLLLPSTSYENATGAIGRAVTAYKRTAAGRSVKVQYSILEALPIDFSEDNGKQVV